MATTLVDGIELLDPRYRGFPTDVEPNDPVDDLRGSAVDPVWPAMPMAELLATARLSYDRSSDTLHMRFPGGHRPILNVHTQGYTDLLVDLDTHEVVGLEVQKLLLKAAKECPELLNALDDAELRGITHDEVLLEKAKVFSTWTLTAMLVKAVVRLQVRGAARLRRRGDRAKRAIVIDYYRNQCRGVPT